MINPPLLLLVLSTGFYHGAITAQHSDSNLFSQMLYPFVEDRYKSFGAVIQCAKGGPLTVALSYNGYGCWCGKGNVGNTEVDEIDHACHIHDECYGQAENGSCDAVKFSRTAKNDWYQVNDCSNGIVTDISIPYPPNSSEFECINAIFICDAAFAAAVKDIPLPESKKTCPDCRKRGTNGKYRYYDSGHRYLINEVCMECKSSPTRGGFLVSVGCPYRCGGLTYCMYRENPMEHQFNGVLTNAWPVCNGWPDGDTCKQCLRSGQWCDSCC